MVYRSANSRNYYGASPEADRTVRIPWNLRTVILLFLGFFVSPVASINIINSLPPQILGRVAIEPVDLRILRIGEIARFAVGVLITLLIVSVIAFFVIMAVQAGTRN